jgi:hypothetical protein
VTVAPAKLKTQLDHILRIQSELKTLESTVARSNALLGSGALPKSCRPALEALQKQFNELKSKADGMYASLNVTEDFPNLEGVSFDFMQKMFLVRELKANVQRRATHVFWEFDKLDRAAGGKDMATGTHL